MGIDGLMLRVTRFFGNNRCYQFGDSAQLLIYTTTAGRETDTSDTLLYTILTPVGRGWPLVVPGWQYEPGRIASPVNVRDPSD